MSKTGTTIIVALLICACGGGGGGSSKFQKLVDGGWDAFTGGDLQVAIDDFEAATMRNPENVVPYVGLGWSYMQLGNLTSANSSFSTGSSKLNVTADLHAGWAFVLNALKEYDDSNDQIDLAFGLTSNWIFQYDNTINSDHLHLMQAQNYFLLGMFAQSLVSVQIVNPSFSTSTTTEAGVGALLVEIERLHDEI